MRLQTTIAALIGVSCAAPPDGIVDERVAASATPAAYLADTQSRLVASSTTGRTYQISVALPRGYDKSDTEYPVLYALDANGEFGMVVESARMLQLEGAVPELVIVGVGYPVGHFVDAMPFRTIDLTVGEDPRLMAEWPAAFPPPEGSGEAAAFLTFLTGELIPLVDAEYRVDAADRALYGHSFGGLFGFFALFNSGGLFRRYIIASPALSWAHRAAFLEEAEYAAAHDTLTARAFLSVGLLEPDIPGHPWAEFVTALRDVSAVLEERQYRGFEWTTHFFEDETHNSVIPFAVSRGLRFIYARE